MADLFEGRFKGTVDLDAEALSAVTLDGLVFAVVAVRVEELGATTMTRDGRTRRKDVFKVEEARFMVGENRDHGMEFIAGREVELPQLASITSIEDLKAQLRREVVDEVAQDGTVREEGMAAHPSRRERPVATGDEEVFVPSVLAVDDEVRLDDPEFADADGAVARIDDYKRHAVAESSGRDGPKIGKFVYDHDDDIVVDRETIGSIHSPDYQGKDKVLQKFMKGD